MEFVSTVFGAVLTFVAGQIVVKLIVEPVQDFKKCIGKVAHALQMRANIISNPGVLEGHILDEASKDLRLLSSDLHMHLRLIPWYKYIGWVFGLPSENNVLAAASSLIGLSNSVYRSTGSVFEANQNKVEKIHAALGIYLSTDDKMPVTGV